SKLANTISNCEHAPFLWGCLIAAISFPALSWREEIISLNELSD
ncbi:7105_t:CDS:1, partial [Dentiscutata erythropus]